MYALKNIINADKTLARLLYWLFSGQSIGDSGMVGPKAEWNAVSTLSS